MPRAVASAPTSNSTLTYVDVGHNKITTRRTGGYQQSECRVGVWCGCGCQECAVSPGGALLSSPKPQHDITRVCKLSEQKTYYQGGSPGLGWLEKFPR